MNVSVTEDEVGKDVVNKDGEELGTVADVDTGTVQFEATEEFDAGEAVREVEEQDGAIYEVEEEDVAEVTGQEVQLDQ